MSARSVNRSTYYTKSNMTDMTDIWIRQPIDRPPSSSSSTQKPIIHPTEHRGSRDMAQLILYMLGGDFESTIITFQSYRLAIAAVVPARTQVHSRRALDFKLPNVNHLSVAAADGSEGAPTMLYQELPGNSSGTYICRCSNVYTNLYNAARVNKN